MIKILEHVPLASYSSFMVQAEARYFVSISSPDELPELMNHELWGVVPLYVLGSGTNTLFIGQVDRLVLKNEIIGLEIVTEDEETLTLHVGAGEQWHDLVLWSIDQHLWGFENLALIPGTVGAAPVQNIGAYGVEVAEYIAKVEAFDTEHRAMTEFTPETSHFGYRDSLFKQHPGRYIITHVTFTLPKKGKPNLSYKQLEERIKDKQLSDPSPSDIAHTVINIRDQKLPRVGEIGMAGSFFKNPVISREHWQSLQHTYPDMPHYILENGQIKIPAGWLIEQIGYKGIKKGKVGTYHKHALVLVNYGGAQGHDVYNFVAEIQEIVQKKFNIYLEPEVNIIAPKK